MNNDFISRSALLKEMNDYCGNQRYLIPENVWEMVENMPTAYDVDMVCRKINENKDMDNLIDADHAIKIVISGLEHLCQ